MCTKITPSLLTSCSLLYPTPLAYKTQMFVIIYSSTKHISEILTAANFFNTFCYTYTRNKHCNQEPTLRFMSFIRNCHQSGQRWHGSQCVGRCLTRVEPTIKVWSDVHGGSGLNRVSASVQQKLRLNRGQGQIWTWFKLDRRWWNAP